MTTSSAAHRSQAPPPAAFAEAEFDALPGLPMKRLRLHIGQRLSVAVYDSWEPARRAEPGALPPLLLVHRVNAAASAFEMEPLMQRHAPLRRVMALDLPGFAGSDKPPLHYQPQLMRDAIVAVLDRIDAPQVDLLALSLGAEFATEAALARPPKVRTPGLVSPAGMGAGAVASAMTAVRARSAGCAAPCTTRASAAGCTGA